jgi:hypothetical protein
MKTLIATILVTAATAAFAANLVSQSRLADGRTVCVYSDGTSFVTTFNNCPSFK